MFNSVLKFRNIGYHFSLVSQAALSASCFSFYLWSFCDNGLFIQSGSRAAFVFFFVAVFLFAFLTSPFLTSPVCHPIIGSYFFILGIDCYVRSGWAIHISTITGAQQDAYYHVNRKTGIEMAFVLIIAAVGIIFQVWQVRNTAYRLYHNI
ncbi:hypothetical protein AYI68_g1390 [Smittium mucronatum]|uniref:TM7S3/TM198-like domain-containing protein n=1 Tax=Smittium mucronatum TaxID=133383 RepID=A0A1R0H5T3_9FUNG|nr:hypothetical protein AYI68_g1390 [Smittium mucronatum]